MTAMTAAMTATDERAFATEEPKSGVFRISCRPVAEDELRLYMNLVHHVVARFLRRLPPSVLREDLVAAGTYGLMDALRKTQDTVRDARFEGYAMIRIRGAIIDELRQQDWLARSARADANAQARAAGRSSTTIVGIDDVPEAQRPTASNAASPFDVAARISERKALADAVSRLPAREAQIVRLHYFEGVPFKDLASMLGVSEPRVSQLHSRALALLKPLLIDHAEGFAA